MYSFPNLEPVHFTMSSSNYCFLTCIQVFQEAGNVVWYCHLFKNFPVCCDPHSQRLQHSQWSRSRLFFWNPLGFPMSQWILAVWSLVPLPFLYSVCTSGSPVHILLKPSLEDFEYNLSSMWSDCSCAVVWAFFGIAFLRDWTENWPFPVLCLLLSFPNFLAYWVQHFHNIIF